MWVSDRGNLGHDFGDGTNQRDSLPRVASTSQVRTVLRSILSRVTADVHNSIRIQFWDNDGFVD